MDPPAYKYNAFFTVFVVVTQTKEAERLNWQPLNGAALLLVAFWAENRSLVYIEDHGLKPKIEKKKN